MLYCHECQNAIYFQYCDLTQQNVFPPGYLPMKSEVRFGNARLVLNLLWTQMHVLINPRDLRQNKYNRVEYSHGIRSICRSSCIIVWHSHEISRHKSSEMHRLYVSPSSAHWEKKNGVILTLKVESLAELKFDPGFRVIGEYLSQFDSILSVNLNQIYLITRNTGSNFSSVSDSTF